MRGERTCVRSASKDGRTRGSGCARPSGFVGAILATLLTLTPATAQQRDAGERAFQKCYSCHSVDAREKGLSGPALQGVIGRRAASQPDFAYSPALKKAAAYGLVWSEETLERYMADPLEMIPETTMSFPGMRDPAERRAVIEYLRRFR